MKHDHRYPSTPGHRGIDTSMAAAEALERGLGYLQALVFRTIFSAGADGMTTNEIADCLAIDRGSIQPRTSELRAKRRIKDSGRRRLNANGKKAIVWVAVGEGN